MRRIRKSSTRLRLSVPSGLHLALATGGAMLLAVVYATQLRIWLRLFTIPVDFATALLWSLPHLMLWLLLVPSVYRLAARWPIAGRWAVGRGLAHLAASIVLAFAVLVAVHISELVLHWSVLVGAPGRILTNYRITMVFLHIGVAVYWVTVAAQHALSFRREAEQRALRASQLEKELVEAQLTVLRAQLDPHFLFNTLNSIEVLIRRDAPLAQETLRRLSSLLRGALRAPVDQFVSLEEELRHVSAYLGIEQIRFADRLTVEWDIACDTPHLEVPSLLLQPLVENAIRHGIAPRERGGTVRIAARQAEGSLLLEVCDDGIGFSRGVASGNGVGLGNTRRRLEALFGREHQLTIGSDGRTGTSVRIQLPLVEIRT